MSTNKNNSAKMGLTIGIFGLIAGIFLAFSGQTLIGVCGSIASAAIAYKGFSDLKKSK